jgi:hypothetical protein
MSEYAEQTYTTDAIFLTGAILSSGWRIWVFVGLLIGNSVFRAIDVVQRRRL